MTYIRLFYFDIISLDFKLLFMQKLISIFQYLILLTSLFLCSCGYVSDKPVENADLYRADQLQTCKIDVSQLNEIFKVNQIEQIRCLEENFIQFTRYVRAKNPGSVSEAELGMFVKKFFRGQSDSIINGLSLIFQLNMILLKDEADRITNTKISPLFELLINVNKEAVIITNIIKTLDNQKNQHYFWDMKKQFAESIERFSKITIEIIDSNAGASNQILNINNFILDIGNKIGNGKIEQKNIDAFIFIKKALIGGDEHTITSNELKRIITKLPSILNLVFDIYYVKSENFKTESEERKFYLISIRNLYQLIEFNQKDFELLSSDELVHIARKLLKNVDVRSFQESVEILKVKLLGGSNKSFTLKDLDALLNMAHDYFEKIYHLSITYDDPTILQLLSQKRMLQSSELVLKNLAGYDVFRDPKRLSQLNTSFIDTATAFRYFRIPTTGAPFYENKIERSKKGFIELNIAKWLSWKLLNSYGHLDQQKQMQLTIDEFSKFLLDAKPILTEFKLWSPNFQSFSRNAVLLADLFQSHSNGDQKININESTEFLIMLLTAVHISDKIKPELNHFCDSGINADDPLFDKSCFNENFFELLLNKLNFKNSFPRLHKYYSKAGNEETIQYLLGIEGFARDDDRPGVPVNSRDMTLITGAMLNIESTFIRFDKNADNIIDYNELDEAFLTYKQSIISLAALKPEKEKYAKGIFMYMVSKMEIPKITTLSETAEFAIFNTCVQDKRCRDFFMDKIEAKRLNIGKLLFYMVNQNAPSPSIPSKK